MINYRQPPGSLIRSGSTRSQQLQEERRAAAGESTSAGRVKQSGRTLDQQAEDAARADAARADRIARRAAGESVDMPGKASDATRTRAEKRQDERQAAAGRSTSAGRIRRAGRSFAARAEEKEARALAESLQSANTAVTVGMFPALFRQCWPELLKGLLQPGVSLDADIQGEIVATLDKPSGKAVWDVANTSFPKNIVIRGVPVPIPDAPERYLHVNLRTRTITPSDSAEAPSAEVEVYDKQNMSDPHLTGF